MSEFRFSNVEGFSIHPENVRGYKKAQKDYIQGCFPVNMTKFLRTTFLIEHLRTATSVKGNIGKKWVNQGGFSWRRLRYFSHPTFTCSRSTIETLEEGAKNVQS